MRPGILGREVAAAGVDLLHEAAAVRQHSRDDRAGREAGERDLEPVALGARVAEQHQLAADRVDGEVDAPVVVEVGRSETTTVDLGHAHRARPPSVAAANSPG